MSTISTIATLIADGVETSAGRGGASTSESTNVGSNAIHEIASDWYVVAMDDTTNVIQMYKSTDSGATWSTVGSTYTATRGHGGLASVVVGTKIYVCVGNDFSTGSHRFGYVNFFETTTDTWDTEVSFDLGASTNVEVYTAHKRSDDSIVFIISNSVAPSRIYAVAYDGASFTGPTALTPGGVARLFEASVLVGDDVYVFTVLGFNLTAVFRYVVFDSSNSASSETTLSFTGTVLSWSDEGLLCGFEASGTFYMAAGKRTADYPTIWGKPVILYGSGGSWTLGQELETDPGMDDYSVYQGGVVKLGSTLVYFYRGVSSDGNTYIDRIGYAPVGSHDTPGDWTWTTVYDLSSPSPAVSGESTPYDVQPNTRGFGIGIQVASSSQARIIGTLRNSSAGKFAAYLYEIILDTIAPSAISSEEALGSPVINGAGPGGEFTISPTSIPSAEAFGTASLSGAPGGSQTVGGSGDGIPSSEHFGNTQVGGTSGSGTRYSVF